MKFNTASNVIALLSAAGLCSAVIDMRTGVKVTDLQPVIQALQGAHTRYEPHHFHCPILENYGFTFNEKLFISEARRYQIDADGNVPYEAAFENAALEDELDENTLTLAQSKTFYQKTAAFYRVCQYFRYFKGLVKQKTSFRNEVALAYEFQKIQVDGYIYGYMISDIIRDPVAAKRTLFNDQNRLIELISNALSQNNDYEKNKALENLKPIKSNPELIKSLLRIRNAPDFIVSILNTLIRYKVIDKSIRDCNEIKFARDQPFIRANGADNLSFILSNLRPVYDQVLYIMDNASPLEIEAIIKLNPVGDTSNLNKIAIKRILCKNERELENYILSVDENLISRIKYLLERGEGIHKSEIDLIDLNVIIEIITKDNEIKNEAHLSSEQIRAIFENHGIVRPIEEFTKTGLE